MCAKNLSVIYGGILKYLKISGRKNIKVGAASASIKRYAAAAVPGHIITLMITWPKNHGACTRGERVIKLMKKDQIDRKILNLIQAGFPVSPEPYREIGEALGISEENVIARIKNMLDCGIIRRLGGIFDSGKLGYHSTLCAMKVEESRIDAVAAVVNAYPGVTHNYLRDHELNMWFTATAQSQEDLEYMLNQIRRDTGINDILSMPAEKIFKIRVNFVLD